MCFLRLVYHNCYIKLNFCFQKYIRLGTVKHLDPEYNLPLNALIDSKKVGEISKNYTSVFPSAQK